MGSFSSEATTEAESWLIRAAAPWDTCQELTTVSQEEKHFNLPSAYQAAKGERVSEHQGRRVSTDGLCRPLLRADPPTALHGGDMPGRPRHASQSPGSQSRASLGGGGGQCEDAGDYCVLTVHQSRWRFDSQQPFKEADCSHDIDGH